MTASDTTVVRRRRRAALHLLAAASFAVFLAGCHERQVAENYPQDYRLRHPITLKEGEHTVEVFVGRNRGGLTPVQRADVLAFAQQWRHEAMSGIIVDVPHGTPADRAAADSMREIHSIFAASGVPQNAVYVRAYRPASAALTSIRINYAKLVAEAGPCGQWPQDLGPSASRSYFENQNYWNLGCASQRNLAAMVDNPADLVQPRGESPAYAGRRSVALDKYRKGEIPGGLYPSDGNNGYDNGKLSDLGK
jgi:pilus assembly protein CpaD